MNRVKLYYDKGKYYGYLECCIKHFCDNFSPLQTHEQEQVHENFGFIPCPSCAKKVFNKEIKLKDLIKNRICPTDFPNEHQYVPNFY